MGDARATTPRPRPLWRHIGGLFIDLAYPPVCPGCDQAIIDREPDGSRPPLCPGCRDQLVPVLPPWCDRCGHPFDAPVDLPFTCSNCLGRQIDFQMARAPYRTRGVVRQMIHQFKFGRSITLRHPLARLMEELFHDGRISSDEPWILVPVPLHPARRRHRGFNQAEELATCLGKRVGFPVVHALRREKATTPQTRLGRDQRLANLRAAMHPRPRAAQTIQGRPLLLVDDVLTTGATAQACSEILLGAGAAKVVVITVARG